MKLFCADCRNAFKVENAARRRKTREQLREASDWKRGMRRITGGRQAINFGNSDEYTR
jgi:hypothetical protein